MHLSSLPLTLFFSSSNQKNHLSKSLPAPLGSLVLQALTCSHKLFWTDPHFRNTGLSHPPILGKSEERMCVRHDF